MPAPLDVPALVQERANANGRAGQQWLADLPDVVAELTRRWDLELGPTLGGGTAGLVVAVTDGSGGAAVLKVPMPLDMDEGEAFVRSVRVHQLAAGRGCAELLAHSESPPALVLERLGANLHELGLELPAIMGAITSTLRSFWQPVADDAGLPSGADKAAWLAAYITTTWDELARPCGRDVIDRAVDYCDERAAAFDATAAVLVHGDAHGWNTVAASPGGFKFVDPEGLRSERAHDLSVAMREYNAPLLAGATRRLAWERAELLASLGGVDPQPVWEWGFIERVSTGLANLRDFESERGSAFLAVAQRCL